jgi:hypothetical protein
MKPKEKAKELVESFEDDLMECDTYFLEDAKKRCALIAVDEVLNNYYKNHFQSGKKIDYWIEVKQEIEKL